jgi:hypothetical protein
MTKYITTGPTMMSTEAYSKVVLALDTGWTRSVWDPRRFGVLTSGGIADDLQFAPALVRPVDLHDPEHSLGWRVTDKDILPLRSHQEEQTVICDSLTLYSTVC